jgi:hypothetical protein
MGIDKLTNKLDTDFWTFYKIALKKIPGVEFVFVGYNGIALSGIKTTIWELGDNVPVYEPVDTPIIDTISSSSALDTQLTFIEGISGTGESVEQAAVLDGQNKVTLSTPLAAINGMSNISTFPGVPYAGDIYCYINTAITLGKPDDLTKIKGFIKLGFEEARHSFYTVPLNKTAMLTYFNMDYLGGNPNVDVQGTNFVRLFENRAIKRLGVDFSLNSNSNFYEIDVSRTPFPIPNLSFIAADVTPTGGDVSVSGVSVFVLIDNDFL